MKLAVALLSAVGSLGLAEVLVRSIDLFAEARNVTREQEHESAAVWNPQGPYLLHPYLGYAGNPAHRRGLIAELELSRIFPDGPTPYYQRNRRINAHGFPSEHADYTADSGGYHVGIFGGSVAEQLATVGGEALIAELERREPELRGRVRVFNCAIGGYKQPQQLITLILLMMQGVRFDAIVNLDGFNEVALSSADASERYDPLFPARHQYLVMLNLDWNVRSTSTIERYAEVIRTRRRESEWRAAADHGLLGRSELARSVLGRVVLELGSRASQLEGEIQAQASAPPSLAVYEPACLRDREHGCWDRIVGAWEAGSLEMAAIAARIGARYVHVLQPNQYDEGSKSLSEQERKFAYGPDHIWRAGVRRGYPLLRARIPGMLERGVAVHDLSRLFAGVTESLYVDTCCHLNLRGSSALAAAIADQIAAAKVRQGD